MLAQIQGVMDLGDSVFRRAPMDYLNREGSELG